jgi:hypothetical protein
MNRLDAVTESRGDEIAAVEKIAREAIGDTQARTKQRKPTNRLKLSDVELEQGPDVDAKRDAVLTRFLNTPPKPNQSKR